LEFPSDAGLYDDLYQNLCISDQLVEKTNKMLGQKESYFFSFG